MVSECEIVYGAELPMVQGERYLLHNIEVIPVSMTNVTKKPKVEKEIAYAISTGNVFIPAMFTGARPHVCLLDLSTKGSFCVNKDL